MCFSAKCSSDAGSVPADSMVVPKGIAVFTHELQLNHDFLSDIGFVDDLYDMAGQRGSAGTDYIGYCTSYVHCIDKHVQKR